MTTSQASAISVTILTKNSEKYLKRVLNALGSFSEVVVVDTGSEDATQEIASQFSNVVFYKRPFIGFGPTHNVASSLAKNDWILSIDSDEIATEELVNEITSLTLNPEGVYSLWRKNYYRGRHIRGCGWYPDRVIRLYNRTTTQFTDALVHESIVTTNMKVLPLSECVVHYPYSSISAFLKKMDAYTDLYAAGNSSKKSSIFSAFLHGVFAFFRSYILQRGFLLGSEGFEISWYQMNCAFYKYAKLYEKSIVQTDDTKF
jgi:glycosyltransferase involved in cell wall biosynthesis